MSRSGQRKVLPAMGAAMTNDNVVRHKQQPHELSSHKLTAANSAAYPQVHYLDHHWYLVPVDDGTKKDNSKTLKSTIAKIVGKHSLEDHELVVTGSARTAHSLESDAKISHHGQRSSHQLHQDATTPIGNSSGDSPHMLCCDPVADEARAVVYHELQAHQPMESTRADHYHELGQDVLVGTRGGAVTKHDIHADEVVKSHETEPPHLLADDGTVQSSSKSWAHAIDADKTAVTSQSGLGTHQLNAHRKVAKIDKGLTSHGLSKD
ncbi:hypothetical protein ED733_002069 [Metarhizium rileyi]|uniref:Uncharacterized protein n=1 Tax=Metarhizium rileyi (strain RCEF 4871) TaxID=1649241 RepID=A0A5C6GD22_METRR|nr:hypothetical protein ED733_002069 [Metarhizium rileyi]